MAETILEVQDLSREIDNGATIFSNVSFNVNEGSKHISVAFLQIIDLLYCKVTS
jgi:ATPase subunit of ABC transporter with duplicated ATPase domains